MARINRFASSNTLYNSKEDTYFHWLYSLIKPEIDDDFLHWLLIKHLYKRTFYWSVPNDDNRAADGKKLRDMYRDEEDDYCRGIPFGECNILEMIIGLSIRCNDMMFEPDEGNMISKWFWEMINNLGLMDFTDDAYFDLGGSREVDKIIDRLLDRTYRRNGKGGLFPLQNPKKDQRKVELWYQMSTYLLENYYIDTHTL